VSLEETVKKRIGVIAYRGSGVPERDCFSLLLLGDFDELANADTPIRRHSDTFPQDADTPIRRHSDTFPQDADTPIRRHSDTFPRSVSVRLNQCVKRISALLR
jgi:hypothetical protein